ncbi:unnamed protein product [Pseudo-nitzschia multistriata]|uniref:C2 domain-containing protein n=1 Tax=Pseudo-nitzschia multistriata TaxID=183589 RepID=A0A448ZDN9_9STRA|nr:unnamed protein product [Pseudo-nitzschia multistriata]
MGYPASASTSTYEFARARESSGANPDQIHYDPEAAFRNQDYRRVFHQDGTIGTFSVRLLEASGLSRRYWSALALGPMKHLGLSKAHGGVSSYVSLCLDAHAREPPPLRASGGGADRKMPAFPPAEGAPHHLADTTEAALRQTRFSSFVSPVVPNNNDPVWNNCVFEIPLQKGALGDGQPVRISLRVDEDATAIENMIAIPGIGIAPGPRDRLLGVGGLDVTALCLGQNPATGRPATGVVDAWIPIKHPDDDGEEFGEEERDDDDDAASQQARSEEELLRRKQDSVYGGPGGEAKPAAAATSGEGTVLRKRSGGRVRVLVTYQPHGMDPQKHDVVALEAFARQNPSTATCGSVLPPLLPMVVAETEGPWLLVRYRFPPAEKGTPFGPERDHRCEARGLARVHRNAVFVIERKTLADGALGLALAPAELVLSTPLGRGATEALGPALVAGRKLLEPALLSSRLLWMAVRTTAKATATGVSAAGSAFVREGATSLTSDGPRSGGRRASGSEAGRVRYV